MARLHKNPGSGRKTRRVGVNTPGAAREALVAVITSAIAQRSLTPITRRLALKPA